MRIMIFIPTLETGGAERVVSRLAPIWGSYKDVTVYICLLKSINSRFILPDYINIITLKSNNNKLLNNILVFYRFRKLVINLKPDVIQSFMAKYNLVALFSVLGLKQRVIVSERANPLLIRNRLSEFGQKALYPTASGIIAQTELSKQVLKTKRLNKRIAVIPNPIKITSEICDYSAKVILNVGRLIKEKGQLDLIDAFKRIKNKNGWKLLIIGDGPLRTTLEKKLVDESIDNVEILGFKDNVEKYYKTSSIFSFSSFSEGYPNALIEAMSYGLPAVSYDCPSGPSDILRHEENGFLIKVGDVEGLSFYMQKLINDYDLRIFIGTNAKRDISSNAEDVIAEKWFNFITHKK